MDSRELARQHAAAGRWHDALLQARAALSGAPDDVEMLFVAFDAAIELGQKREAIDLGRNAVQRNPGEYSVWFRLGQLYLGVDDLERAADAFSTASADPDLRFDAVSARCFALSSLGRGDEALRHAVALDDQARTGRTADLRGEVAATVAEKVPRVRTDQRYLITSAAEIQAMKEILEHVDMDRMSGSARRLVDDVHNAIEESSRMTSLQPNLGRRSIALLLSGGVAFLSAFAFLMVVMDGFEASGNFDGEAIPRSWWCACCRPRSSSRRCGPERCGRPVGKSTARSSN